MNKTINKFNRKPTFTELEINLENAKIESPGEEEEAYGNLVKRNLRFEVDVISRR